MQRSANVTHALHTVTFVFLSTSSIKAGNTNRWPTTRAIDLNGTVLFWGSGRLKFQIQIQIQKRFDHQGGSMRSSSTYIETCSCVRAVGTVYAPRRVCDPPSVCHSFFSLDYTGKKEKKNLDSELENFLMWGFALETFEIVTKCH